MSGFWSSADKIPIRQTKVSLPAENGLNYKAGQVIHFSIPPNIEFIQPKETYLRMDIAIDDTAWAAGGFGGSQRFQLDKMGGSVVIKDIRIFAGGAGGTLLEEIQDYNVLTALRYSYEQNESLRNKRSLTEGSSQFNAKCRSTQDNSESDTNNVTENPNFDAFDDSNVAQATAHVQRKVKCLLPLHTGIFQNDKVFPCLLTDGLRIEILLENAPRCIVPVSQVSDNAKLNEKVIFHSRDDPGTPNLGGVDNLQDTTGRWDSPGAAAVTTIWVRRDNSQTTGETFPFAVGEYFDFVDMTQDVTQTLPAVTTRNASVMTYTSSDGLPMQIASINHYAWSGNAAAVGGWWGLTKITLANTVQRTAANTRIMGSNTAAEACWVMVSRTLATATASQVSSLNLAITDVELIVQQLEMPNQYKSKLMKMMKEGGSLNYDFLSYRNYKSSALASDTQVNMRIPLVESRAKAILCVPTDSSVYTDKCVIQGTPCNLNGESTRTGYANIYPDYTPAIQATYAYDTKNEKAFLDGSSTERTAGNQPAALYKYVPSFSQRSGLVGIWDYLTNYQLFYDGKLNPSRKVDCRGVSSGKKLSQQWAIEAEKALAMAGIRPLSFRDLHENAFIGRALSLNDGVYDTRGKDFSLQLAYEGAGNAVPILSAAPIKNKLWDCYCAHLRRLVVKGNAISLEV
mgnify:CR=1 FL=1